MSNYEFKGFQLAMWLHVRGLDVRWSNVIAFSNKTPNFWMQNMAAVVSPQTCRAVCARVQKIRRSWRGQEKERHSGNSFSPLPQQGRRLFQDLCILRMTWMQGPCFGLGKKKKKKMENWRSMGWSPREGEESSKCGWETVQCHLVHLSSYLGSVSPGF